MARERLGNRREAAVRAAQLANLTPRELTTLQALADGLTLGAAAQREGLGRDAVKQRAAQARLKLEARTNAQAVALAWRAGLVQ